jgi:hypothetical protein
MATPSLAMIPSGYKASKVYSVLPESGVGDFDFTRATTATRVNSSGLIEEMAINVPRLEYPLIDGVVNGCPSLLLEPQATNVIINSNVFTPNSNVILNTDNSISPDGTLNASKVTANSGTSLKLVDTNGASSGTYRFSVFAKKNTHNIIQLGGGGIVGHANFNLETGEYSSGGFMENYGNGWYRCSLQFSAGTPTSHYVSFSDSLSANRLSTSVSTGSFFLFGMQSETTSYTTSYIPTNGSSVTRNAETCNGAGDASTFNSSEGVLMAEISALANDLTNRTIALSDGTTSNTVRIQYLTVSNSIWATVTNIGAGGNQAILQYTSSDITTNSKVSIKYKENDFSLWVDGFEVATDTSGVTFSANTLNTLQFDRGNGNENFYGNTKQLQYYNSALTDSELETLTSWTSFSDMANGQQYSII